MDESTIEKVHEIKLRLVENHHQEMQFTVQGKNFARYSLSTGMIADGMDPFLENDPIEEKVIERTDNNSFEIIN